MESNTVSKLAAVVVTYNGAPWLQACLDSLNASLAPVSTIFVVDNASSDETVAIARKTENVTVIETGENLGFGRGNNIGMARALDGGADFVFILNQDAHVAPDALTKLVAEARAHPGLGILCPMQLDETGASLDPTFMRTYLVANAPEMVNDAFLGKVANSYPVSAAPAAAWLLSRKFLLTVGGFDPLFFMYSEDDDLCARARHHGFGFAIVPHSRFYHSRGFHGNAAHEPAVRRIRRRTSRIRSQVVREIKSPGGRFPNNVWHAMIACFFDGLKTSLNYLDWVDGLSHFAAMVQVMTELPRIARHRNISLRPGSHWLPLILNADETNASEFSRPI